MSDELSAEKEIVKMERKLKKNGQGQFIDDIRAMSEAQLNDQMLILAKHKQDIITAQKKDPDLREARDTVSSLNYPYNNSKRKNDEKSRFVALILKDKYDPEESEQQS